MAPRIIGALLLRNEGAPDRPLRHVLAALNAVCDDIVVLDDHSTDETPTICDEAGCLVYERSDEDLVAWGAEAAARESLWSLTNANCDPRDWILVADGDMVLHGDPEPYTWSREHNAVAWRLYDAWSETEYRAGGFWVGHTTPRIWMVRAMPDFEPRWDRDGLHVGHFPSNYPYTAAIDAMDVYWEHRAYATPAAREAKHAQYMAKADLLSPFERAHAASILDPVP